jgi:Protein of unknown function (DUF1592)/Protein of unknown function (DUF1588)/Protein of unknown function (DUF1587)/Protein of unknown function (DUF1585)/Protein of unknown function (DUF1595)
MRLGSLMFVFACALPATAGDFGPDAVAFLQKHCVACHGEKKKSSGVALHTATDDAGILKSRKTFTSVLRVLDAGEMPPEGKPRPTVEELESFKKAISRTFDAADRTGKADPGRVTVRRLNKTEYANTIRDLVGVDFNPAEDFPADDIGYGFDNIGDVLTLSPVLMERYMSAAEAIVQRAITPNPPKVPQRWVGGKYLEPATDPNKVGKFRPITKGNLNTPYSLSMDGDYVFHLRAYATHAGDGLKASVSVDGIEVKSFTLMDGDDKKVAIHDVKLSLKRGEHRIAVSIANTSKDDKGERTLHIENFMLEGPADTRPATHRKLLACDPKKNKHDQAVEILGRFATKAYRRPATTGELDRLVKLVETIESKGERFETGIQLAMQAVLVSPKFLFRVELDDRADSADPHPIDEYQLASRLSYLLWSTMPDDELFDQAGKKQLAANLEPQVRRMLKDSKATALVDNFVLQWLQLKRLQSFAPDSKMFPQFDDRLRASMLKETQLFFGELIREDHSILDVIDGRYTYVNRPLAELYGYKNVSFNGGGRRRGERDEFVRVELAASGPRGGILTQASILTVTSNPTRTSPVKRGKWVLEQILGTPPPPPPPDVPELKDDAKAVSSASLRQRMEEHRKNPACANCHTKMDSMGFAFENFNPIGAFRAKDGDFMIDPAGVLPDGRSFKDPAELRAILKEKKDLVARNLAEKMLTYALGRGLEWYDRRSVDAIVSGTAKGEYRFSALMAEIVRSDPFRLWRGKGQS